ncbi:MAG: response regulator [Acidobacteria bacterium]|nr:response regulator [Acidobacteriota bacterium]
MSAAPSVILLVEDDPGQADLIRANLEIANIQQEIVHVTDGCQALDFLQRTGPFCDRPPGSALVLLDLRLPRMDGLEFLRVLGSSKGIPRTPVLVFAAEDHPKMIAECYGLGCSLYFSKPFLLEEFLDTVSRLAGLIQAVSVPDGT